jgi:integrase/recombinase XerC
MSATTSEGAARAVSAWRSESFAESLVGRSPHTRAAYERDVGEFVAWAERGGCPGGPAGLDHRTLRRFLAYLDTRGFARSTIARKAAALRAYLRFLRRQGVLERDLGALLRAPKGASSTT